MWWNKLSKPLEDLGKWFLNVGLAFLVGLVIQPFVKSDERLISLGLVAVIIAVLSGISLIFLSEIIKKED
jgi:hypothetical protein